MKKLLLLSCLFVSAAIAAETTPAVNPLSWLDARGVVSSDEMTKALDVKLSTVDQEKFDKALAKRNAEIQKSNGEFAATLRELLRSDDAQIAKRVEAKSDEDKESAKLALMKRTQPARYEAYMRSKGKDKEPAKTP